MWSLKTDGLKMGIFALLVQLCVTFGQQQCDLTAAVGDNVTIPLGYPGYTEDNHLMWECRPEHNYLVAFNRVGDGIIVTGKEGDVTSDGSLVLRAVRMEQTGEYSAMVWNNDGERLYTSVTQTLCVTEPVSKPSVTRSCYETQCTLVCEGQETRFTKYTWKENNEPVKEGNTLVVEKSGDRNKRYTCVLSNPVSQEDSDPVSEEDLFPGSFLRPAAAAGLAGGAAVALGGCVTAALVWIYFKRKLYRRLSPEVELKPAAGGEDEAEGDGPDTPTDLLWSGEDGD